MSKREHKGNFLERYNKRSVQMRKNWVARNARHAANPTYNMSITVTKETAPGTVVAMGVEKVNISEEEKEEALGTIRALVLESKIALTPWTRQILCLNKEEGQDEPSPVS